MLTAAPELPTTSQPSPGQFLEVFSELINAGHDVLCIVISSKLSGTFQSALDAKSMLPDAHIVVVDTYSAASPLGLMVITAAEMAARDCTMDEIVAESSRCGVIDESLFVDTLNFAEGRAHHGGARLPGTLLKVKPILVLDDSCKPPIRCDQTQGYPVCCPSWFHVTWTAGAGYRHARSGTRRGARTETEVRRRFNCQRIIFGGRGRWWAPTPGRVYSAQPSVPRPGPWRSPRSETRRCMLVPAECVAAPAEPPPQYINGFVLVSLRQDQLLRNHLALRCFNNRRQG
jgi:hypothetical protein